MQDRYLLIIPCSKRKAGLPGAKIPAIDLYDGPFYRIIRKAFRDHGKPDSLDIMILSAKYGLIRADKEITTYDQRMTPEVAKRMLGDIYRLLANKLTINKYREVMVNLGRQYMIALGESHDVLDKQKVRYGSGGIGERNKQLKEWLFSIYNMQQ